MYAMREANIHSLLNCDPEDVNKVLEEFYEKNLDLLMKCPIGNVREHVLRDIAVMLHANLPFKTDWRCCASEMGIEDNYLLDKIEVRCNYPGGEIPLYFVLKGVLSQTKTFGHIIVYLLEAKKFNILRKIYLDVRDLIEKISTTEIKVAAIDRESSEFQIKQFACQEDGSETASSADNITQHYTCVPNLANECIKREFNTLQLSSMNRSGPTKIKVQNSSVIHNNLSEECSSEEMNIFPSAPEEERISVFIQHTQFDTDKAQQLCTELRNAGFCVKTMSNMDVAIAMNQTQALLKIFQEVDFIVPIVSETLLQQIHSTSCNELFESTDAINNKNFYDLIMNEYTSNGCINLRVRPVIVPTMNRRRLIHDVVLSFSFRLWQEVPKLARILRETKQLIPEYRLQIGMA